MENAHIEKIKSVLNPSRILENEPLSKHTYFKIGGPARLFFEAKTAEDLKLALQTAYNVGIACTVLGGGANVLVSDEGFDGLVIKNRASGTKVVSIKGNVGKSGTGVKSAHVWAASGTLMNQLARFTLDQGLEGLEFLLSVPGTVGGGLKINAHFEVEKGEFLGQKLDTAALFDPKTGEVKTVKADYFEFSYDHSRIQETGEIVLEAIFKLERAKDQKALMQKAVEGVKRRNQEQPIGIACSGCTFRNISQSDAKRLKTPNGTTSTGYIIDSLGLKGTKIGGAEISAHHANFILNTADATASDVIRLIKIIKERVMEKYDIDLKEEIFYIGSF